MAEVRPFNYSSFAFSLNGCEAQGCKSRPSGRFIPTDLGVKNPGVAFSGYYNHEMMEKPSYYQVLSFDQFRYFINVLRMVATTPGEDQIVQQLPLRYFKDGEFKFGGTTIGIVREPTGEVFFAFKNKKIPTIKFYVKIDGGMEHQNGDREAMDVRVTSQLGVKTICDRWEAMLNDSISKAVSDGESGRQSTGGNNWKNNSNKPANNNNASSSNKGYTPDAAAGSDFDEDIPF